MSRRSRVTVLEANPFFAAKILFDFVAEIAWPAVVLIVVLLFRDQIERLWSKLATVDVAGVKLTFDQRLAQAESAIQEEKNANVGMHGDIGEAQIISPADRFQRLLDISPSAAIVDKWVEIDNALRLLAERRNLNTKYGQPMMLIKTLLDAGAISQRVAGILDELRILRNLAAHPGGSSRVITRDEARRFGEVSDEVLALLLRK